MPAMFVLGLDYALSTVQFDQMLTIDVTSQPDQLDLCHQLFTCLEQLFASAPLPKRKQNVHLRLEASCEQGLAALATFALFQRRLHAKVLAQCRAARPCGQSSNHQGY